jgi:CheY-like chemotaxis protein
MLAPMAETKGLAFRCDVADDVPYGVRGDAHRVRQILLNLGNNAIKFTERGGVTLRATALPVHGVRIDVADTGPGLDAVQQLRLFQRFEQAEGARTAARYGGSGLGLAICRELATAMGGTIGVASVPGHGACFHVELPLPVAEPAAVRLGETCEPPAAHRILLVEDDPVVAGAIRGLLEAQGHFVTHAPHGLAALSALHGMRHDLGFIDLDLPGIDGLALARLLRAQGHALPLVAITARADNEAEALALAAGMDAFLRKPVDGTLLQQAIAATDSAAREPRRVVA